jgi:hypothetical protein
VLAKEELAERLYNCSWYGRNKRSMSKGKGYFPAKVVTRYGWDAVSREMGVLVQQDYVILYG